MKPRTTLSLALLATLAFTAGAQDAANAFATISADSATFSGNTISLSGVAQQVSYYTSYPASRAGSWLTQNVADKFINGHWLGAPDGALYAWTENGKKVALILGYLSSPNYNWDGNTLTFNAHVLGPDDKLARTSGVANWLQSGAAKSDYILTAAPSYPLYKVAIVLDLRFAPSDISKQLVIPPGDDSSIPDSDLIADNIRVGPF